MTTQTQKNPTPLIYHARQTKKIPPSKILNFFQYMPKRNKDPSIFNNEIIKNFIAIVLKSNISNEKPICNNCLDGVTVNTLALSSGDPG